MILDRVLGTWMQLRGKLRARWGRMTGNQFEVVMGSRDQLLGRSRVRYAIVRDDARRALEDFKARFGGGMGKSPPTR